jgi:hypothetical protein
VKRLRISLETMESDEELEPGDLVELVRLGGPRDGAVMGEGRIIAAADGGIELEAPILGGIVPLIRAT